jgi:hypothetical protein
VGDAALPQRQSPGNACWRRARPFIGSDSDLVPSDRLYAALFGYLNLPEPADYVASGRRMANLPGLTTPNEVRLASDVQLGEHGSVCPSAPWNRARRIG